METTEKEENEFSKADLECRNIKDDNAMEECSMGYNIKLFSFEGR